MLSTSFACSRNTARDGRCSLKRAVAPRIYSTQVTSLQMLLRAAEMDTRLTKLQFSKVNQAVNDIVQVLSSVSTLEPAAPKRSS